MSKRAIRADRDTGSRRSPARRYRLLSKRLILAAALDLTQKTGLQGVTMRALSESLRVSAPAIYWHYENQRSLIQAIVGEVCAKLIGHVDDPAADWRDRLRAFLRHGFDLLMLFPGTARFMMIEGRSAPHYYKVQEFGTRILVEAGMPASEAALRFAIVGHTMVAILDWHEQVTEEHFARALDTTPYPAYHAGRVAMDDPDPHVRSEAAIDMFIWGFEHRVAMAACRPQVARATDKRPRLRGPNLMA